MFNFLNTRKNYLILNWFILNSITTFFNKIMGMGFYNIRVGFYKLFYIKYNFNKIVSNFISMRK